MRGISLEKVASLENEKSWNSFVCNSLFFYVVRSLLHENTLVSKKILHFSFRLLYFKAKNGHCWPRRRRAKQSIGRKKVSFSKARSRAAW